MCGIAKFFDPTRVLFATELKGLHASRRFQPKVDRGALALYLRYGRVLAPGSSFQAVQQLAPGSCIEVASDGETITAQPTVYWSVRDVARCGLAAPKQSRTPTNWIDETHARMRSAVAMHTQAIDEGLKLVPRLAEISDEPFADSSQVPTLLVPEFARRGVTVCLSGDGGDEVFGGYSHHRFGDVLWQRLRYLPPLGALLQKLVCWVPYRFRAAMIRAFERALPHGRHIANPERKFERILSLLGVRSRDELYFRRLRGFGAYDVRLDHPRAAQGWFEQSASWARNLFATSALECEGLVDSLAPRQALTDHLSGRQNDRHLLWPLLMLMTWREHWQV